ncbi:MAG: NADH-quinone oxidoreductase subunit NuoN [Pseudomonadota bacterium]|nr:NADH-quinone oxidoreductase subunit NuoN [Pseudomonadota bacterium]
MSPMMLNLRAILPELYLGTMALFLLMAAVFRHRRVSLPMIASTLIALAATGVFLLPHLGRPMPAFNGMLAVNDFVVFSQLIIISAALLTVLIAAHWLKQEGHPSEFLILLLLATLGMLLMVGASDLLTIYLPLEMSSLSLYVLAAFTREHAKSSEAGLKYFVLGALASGMLLFGISLVYGFAGTTNFAQLAQVFAAGTASKGVTVGMILIIVGFCFKLSAVPFHMWTPDVYEGAPTPVTAFLATASKAAGFALFARFLMLPFGHLAAQWQQIIIFVSVASMAVGALGAIMQSNFKRLLAYSSIGHAGFMLMGLAAGSTAGVQAMLIYLAIYVFMSAGAFGCILLMRRGGRYVEDIRELAGLARTQPVMALTLAIFMFSMAGIPPLAGFFGKLYVVLAAVDAGLVWLAVVGVIASVVGGYYYIKVVKIMYFDEPAGAFDAEAWPLLRAGIALAAALTFLFFLMPTPLVAEAKIAAEALLH